MSWWAWMLASLAVLFIFYGAFLRLQAGRGAWMRVGGISAGADGVVGEGRQAGLVSRASGAYANGASAPTALSRSDVAVLLSAPWPRA